jgi:hypothetical protein
MNPPIPAQNASPIAMLRRLAKPRIAQEHCELCSLPVGPEHRHLLEMSSRKVICACDACALRFDGVIGGRFKIIPRSPHSFSDFRLADEDWESLSLPINMAFFFQRSTEGKVVAYYPSPAGPMESLLPLKAWENLIAQNPALAAMEPDVEALLVNRVGDARLYFIAPIDACYELVGLIRIHWKGFSGGEEVWAEISKFFNRLAERAEPLRSEIEVSHA